ncbi:hypothetical protein EUGRSUZ_K02587 [Eucalyptus grandis]|uniref:Uncharacterized protein n=2 Tax=Eucalyptus grandis TaxID=71139 RepID=A0ACC3IV13_EUCGR|nr:hypothetical protein EUGRSUZ_K02587 [Eucalyptus grandis]
MAEEEGPKRLLVLLKSIRGLQWPNCWLLDRRQKQLRWLSWGRRGHGFASWKTSRTKVAGKRSSSLNADQAWRLGPNDEESPRRSSLDAWTAKQLRQFSLVFDGLRCWPKKRQLSHVG